MVRAHCGYFWECQFFYHTIFFWFHLRWLITTWHGPDGRRSARSSHLAAGQYFCSPLFLNILKLLAPSLRFMTSWKVLLELLSNINNTIKGMCRPQHLLATLPAPGALLGLHGSYGGSRRGGINHPSANQSYPSSRREDTGLSLSHSRIRHSYLYLVHIHSSISIFNFILISIYSVVIHCM